MTMMNLNHSNLKILIPKESVIYIIHFQPVTLSENFKHIFRTGSTMRHVR